MCNICLEIIAKICIDFVFHVLLYRWRAQIFTVVAIVKIICVTNSFFLNSASCRVIKTRLPLFLICF